jgi:signal peptidase I
MKKSLFVVIIIWVVVGVSFVLSMSLNKVPSIFNWTTITVMSPSMTASGFKVGDRAVIQSVPQNEIKVGDIIAYFTTSGKDAEIVFHEVVEIVKNRYVTKGTSNETADPNEVDYDLIIGKYVEGSKDDAVLQFFLSPAGVIAITFIPALIIFVMGIQNIFNEIEKINDSKKKSRITVIKRLLMICICGIFAALTVIIFVTIPISSAKTQQSQSMSGNLFYVNGTRANPYILVKENDTWASGVPVVEAHKYYKLWGKIWLCTMRVGNVASFWLADVIFIDNGIEKSPVVRYSETAEKVNNNTAYKDYLHNYVVNSAGSAYYNIPISTSNKILPFGQATNSNEFQYTTADEISVIVPDGAKVWLPSPYEVLTHWGLSAAERMYECNNDSMVIMDNDGKAKGSFSDYAWLRSAVPNKYWGWWVNIYGEIDKINSNLYTALSARR